MSIAIRKNSEYLDLAPGTRIQRERSSPAFIETTEDGKDGIPGEISYPFTLPLSDANMRILGFPDQLPVMKKLQHDVILEDAGMPLSAGKLIINGVTSNLMKNNVGSIDTHILSNISEFWQRVKSKKLSELTLGGPRIFNWNGYSLTNPGFWKHIHDTWSYNSADNGDYVFDPVYCKNYKRDDKVTWINGWAEYSGQIQLAREANYYCLCPQVFLVFILKSIFQEHGYTLFGEVLDDPDFKQLAFLSFRSVDWAVPQLSGPLITPVVNITPKAEITIDLRQHVPPAMTVGEFLVEIQKLLPVAFVINDRQRTCQLVKLSNTAQAGWADKTESFAPAYTLSFEKKEVEDIVYSFERVDDNPVAMSGDLEAFNYQGKLASYSQLPAPSSTYVQQMYYIEQTNQYFACLQLSAGIAWAYFWVNVNHNHTSYLPGNQTNIITSNFGIGVADMQTIFTGATLGAVTGFFLVEEREGNWYGQDAEDYTPWPARIFFHRGRQPFSKGGTMPLATNSIWNYNSSSPQSSASQVGNWALSYKIPGSNYGLIDYWWSKWLPALEMNEKIKGRLYLKFHEYIQFDWNDVLMINNTLYLVKKINETLPYPGYIDIEAMRIK